MKQNTKQKQSVKHGIKKRVTYRPYFRFVPPGEMGDVDDEGTFVDCLDKVFKRRWAAGRRVAQANLKRTRAAYRAGKKLAARYIPDANERRAFFEKLEGSDPAELKLAKTNVQVRTGLVDLMTAIRAGDAEAAAVLVDVVTNATLFLKYADADLLRPYARISASWPVLASREDGWESRATKRLKEIQFGEDTLEGQLRKPHGEGSAPRAWARRIIQTLDFHRTSRTEYAKFVAELRMILQEELPDGEWTIEPVPQWATESRKLEAFDGETLPDWWKLGKAMLRQQCPNFHLHSDWQRYSARWQGLKKGEIQNRILDLIESAFRRLTGESFKRA